MVCGDKRQNIGRQNGMKNNAYYLNEKEIAAFTRRYPSVKRSDVEDLIAHELSQMWQNERSTLKWRI